MSVESSENQFASMMAGKSSADLLKVIENKAKYQHEARIAAIEELERRQEATPELLEEKARIIEDGRQKMLELLAEEPLPKGPTASEIAPGFSGNLFKITGNYLFTPIILYANVLVFIIMAVSGVNVMQPSVEDLVAWGGNFRPMTLDGELWRLFTAMFLHGGILHLALNMYSFIQVGFILETNMGKYRYLIAYLACGLIASIASLAVNDNIVSVGASGAIFGIDGLLLALLVTKAFNISPDHRQGLLSSVVIFVGYNLFFGFAKEGIDNAAHIGGLVTGFLIGLAYSPSLKRGQPAMVVSCAIGAVVLLAVLLVPRFVSNKFGEFQRGMEAFSVNEDKGLWMYKEEMPNIMTSQDSAIYAGRLQKEGIEVWEENLSILNSLTDMPDHLQERIDLLKKYTQLRIQACEVLQRTINDPTTRNEELGKLDPQISQIIEEIQKLNE